MTLRQNAKSIEDLVASHERFATGRPGGQRLILRFADLSGAVLQKRALAGVHLTGSNLASARLAGSDLAHAQLYCCDLCDADLRATWLTNADLRGSSLRGARLYGARLDGADLRDARLARQDATGIFRVWTVDPTRLRRTAEQGDDVYLGVDLRHTSLKRARLSGARLKGADFSGANMADADLSSADLRDCTFADAILTGVDLSCVRIDPHALKFCILEPDVRSQADAPRVRDLLDAAEIWVDSGGSRGTIADISGLDVRPLADAFAGRRLAGLRAERTRAIDVDFSGSLLTGAVFRDADLRGARFVGCDLRGAVFQRARLGMADFTGALFGRINRVGGGAVTTDFAQAEITGALFDGPAPVQSASDDVLLL